MTNELRRVKRAGDAWETVSEDEGGGGGSQPGALTAAQVEVQETPGAGTYTAVVDLPAGSVLFGAVLTVDADWQGGADVPQSVGDESSPTNIINGTGGNIGFAGDEALAWFDSTGVFGANVFAGFGKLYPSGQTITVTVTSDGGTGHTVGWIYYSSSPTITNAVKS